MDLSEGSAHIKSTNLGENSAGSCVVYDGQVRRKGSPPPSSGGTRYWYYEGTGEATAERYRGLWAPAGYIEERQDGTLFVQGFGCTLPGRTEPGVKAAVPEGSCRTGVFAEYGAPELVPATYSFNESEVSMSGEYHGVDRDYTFELEATSVRREEW
jgi:hypothetical protein